MARNNVIVQIDVDSTLYDADPLFAKIAKDKGIKWIDRSPYWFGHQEIGASLQDIKNVFRIAHSKEVVLSNTPYPSAANVINKIAEMEKVKIAYVSDRNPQQSSALSMWLENHGFLNSGVEEIVLSKDKREWMDRNKPRIVIDDRIRTMFHALKLGAEVFSIEHPHNINLRNEIEGINIATSWEEMAGLLYPAVSREISKLGEKNG